MNLSESRDTQPARTVASSTNMPQMLLARGNLIKNYSTRVVQRQFVKKPNIPFACYGFSLFLADRFESESFNAYWQLVRVLNCYRMNLTVPFQVSVKRASHYPRGRTGKCDSQYEQTH